jgi:hypothetical protein
LDLITRTTERRIVIPTQRAKLPPPQRAYSTARDQLRP